VPAERLLDRLREGPVVLVGHSRGCQVAAVAAARDARGRLVELQGAAHMTPQTHPDAVADVLRSWC